MGRRSASKIEATGEVYPALVTAFAFFNEELFHGILPPCLITLQREKATLGYLSPYRHVRYDQELTHEIALNPQYFAVRTVEQTLSTLVHEMVHVRQTTFGQASRSGYHNKEFASWMKDVGLITSDTGRPGGASVGQRMSHYIEPGGRFEIATKKLLKEHAFKIPWVDRFPAVIPIGSEVPPDLGDPLDVEEPDADGSQPSTIAPTKTYPLPPPAPSLPEPTLQGTATLLAWPTDRLKKKPTRAKYVCRGECEAIMYGRPGKSLICGDCKCTYREVPDEEIKPLKRLF